MKALFRFKHVLCMSAAAVATSAILSPASAQQAPSVSLLSATIENDSANDGNFATGPIIDVRGVVTPGSTVYGYAQDGAKTLSLFTRPDAIQPGWLQASTPYNSSLTGQWAFNLSSTINFAPHTITVANTPAIGPVNIMPFVDSMTITADSTGLNPTINWALPTQGYTPTGATVPLAMPSISAINITVSDITDPIIRTNINPFANPAIRPFGSSFQQANVIFGSQALAPTTTSFTMPSNNNNPGNANVGSPILQYGHTYSIGIHLEHIDNPVPGCQLCSVDSRSASIFDYTPIDVANTPNLPPGAIINMPSDLTPIATNSGATSNSFYKFHVDSVGSTSQTFIDPVVADGFIYTVGAGDPLFASVEAVTKVGAGIYQLSVWDAAKSMFDLVDSSFAAGDTFDFTSLFPDGVSEFEITGIDPLAGLDPSDLTAFITGLTFVGPGSFTGTMEALTVDAPASVPEPGTLPLLLSGLGALGFWRWRSKRASKMPAAAKLH